MSEQLDVSGVLYNKALLEKESNVPDSIGSMGLGCYGI
jgi:hypothetical protein